MSELIYFYQHLPFRFDSVVFSVGSFQLDWYSLMYLVGFSVVYLLLRYRTAKGENSVKIKREALFDFFVYVFLGLLIGGRLGYVFFYNFSFYLSNPLQIISPFDPGTHEFIGIYGMSYHGGLAGVLFVSWLFAKKRQINFWHLADFVVPAIPAGYFFGRIGNFLNGELYGRMTSKFWGMYFPGDLSGALRHPSVLYEAGLEGILLFLILWKLRNQKKLRRKMLGLYITLYAFFRIAVEFFRQPDQQIGYIFGVVTLGQILSLGMLFFGLLLLYSQRTKKMI